MSLATFKPTLWAGSVLENYNDAHVYPDLLNRDYEGEIRNQGDTVRISSIGRVTIFDVPAGSDHPAPEQVTGVGQVLQITEHKGFNFIIEDIDKVQTKPKLMGEFTKEAAWGLADAADTFVSGLLNNSVAGFAGGAGTGNWLADRTIGTGPGDADAYETLVDLGTALEDENVPAMGRWCVVPPWYHGMLLKDPRFVSFGTGPNLEVLKNGRIGRAAGFDIRVSTKTPKVGGANSILAGVKAAATFADQIPPDTVEAFRPERRFGDALKGEHLYGALVTRPYALARVDVTPA